MKIRILSVGKKHESWVSQGIEQFLKRLRPPFSAEMIIVPNSSRPNSARQEESDKLSKYISPESWVILLDERGSNLSSPELADHITFHVDKQIVIIIGGAYGVSDELRERADLVWSLSRLVFPHQLVRLILAEQLYRAQEISRGSGYHHD